MANEFVREITGAQLEAGIEGLALVDFWAPWCGPCRMLAPVVEQLAQDFAGKLAVCKVNIDENGEAAAARGIASIPTLIVMKDGKELERSVGARGKAQLAEMINRHLQA